jgi:hypothetical protein
MGWEYRLNGEIRMRKPERSEKNGSKMPLHKAGVKMTEMPSLR